MKMLLKLGYKGGGLGKEGKGISRAVEVTGRKHGAGLGSVPESTGLKANQAIARELQGKPGDPEGDEEAGADRIKRRQRLRSAAEATAEAGAWRKGAEPAKKKSRKTRYVVAADEPVAEAASVKVVDMRGPQTKILTSVGDISEEGGGGALLGQELLHNLSLMVDLSENKLRSFDQRRRALDDEQALLARDAAELEERVRSGSDQLARFANVEQVLRRAEAARSPEDLMGAFRELAAPRFRKEFTLFGATSSF